MDMSTKTAGNYTVYRNRARVAAFALKEDMRLFAAAPALLEAAQAMYELHKDGVSHQLQFHQRAAAIVVLRAAITTATGEEK